MPTPEQFSRRQVEMILRRTAELERRGDESLEMLSAEELEKVAAELGLSGEALRQALAETRAGLLQPDAEPALLDRVFGARSLEVRRFVPGEVAPVRAAVERFLEEQGFQLKRDRGEFKVFEAARGVWNRLRRAFRAGPYRLPREIEVELRIDAVPGGPHPVLVQLRVDASRLRGARVGGAAAAAVAGVAIAVVGATLLPMPVELATWAGGAAAGVGGTLAGRASFRSARERLQIALERFLDFLEHEHNLAPPPRAPARDPISRLVEFLSGDWWR